jgi:hydroxypyruvate isomerase
MFHSQYQICGKEVSSCTLPSDEICMKINFRKKSLYNLQEGITVLIEPIDRLSSPDNFLDSYDQGEFQRNDCAELIGYQIYLQ